MPEIAGFPESRARQRGFTGREAAGEHSQTSCVFPYSLLHHLVAKANNTEEPSRNCSSSGRRLCFAPAPPAWISCLSWGHRGGHRHHPEPCTSPSPKSWPCTNTSLHRLPPLPAGSLPRRCRCVPAVPMPAVAHWLW